MVRITKAAPAREAEIYNLYADVCTQQAKDTFSPNWHLGLYPAMEDIRERTTSGELWLLEKNSDLAGAAILSRGEDSIYADAPWQINDRVCALHLFCVHPRFRGQHLSEAFLTLLLDEAKREGFCAMHLDVIIGNQRAERLYRKMGFAPVEDRKVFYEDCGEIEVRLMEREL